MQYTIEKLLAGDSKIVGYYQTAKKHWEDFFAEHEDSDLSTWSEWLTIQQVSFFEQNCGGRWIGQEIMVSSGFGVLYTTAEGFDENWPTAKKLFQAFEGSMCSIEVKSKVKKTAEFYSVND